MSRYYVSVFNLIMIFAATSAAACDCIKKCKQSSMSPLNNGIPLNAPIAPTNLPPDIPPQKPRNRCCPYDFDSSICRVVDDRLLCGFNRNPGAPKSKDDIVNLHGGCRMRNGRLECGYEHGPYTNPRRPPIWDHAGPQSEYDDQSMGAKDSYETSDARVVLKHISTITPSSVTRIKAVTRCLETGDRIVCVKL